MTKIYLREQPTKKIHNRWSFRRRTRYKILRTLIPLLIYPFVKVLSVVYRWRHKVPMECLDLMASKEPFVAALWHSDMLLIQSLGKRVGWNKKAVAMVALSQIGEIETRLLKLLGYYVVRGSEKKRSKEALEDMKDVLSQGAVAGMAVDGPSGPPREVKAGVVYLARHCQVPIVPFAFVRGREIRLPTWDHTRIPIPLSRCIVTCAKPIYVPKDIDNEEFDRIAKRVGDVLKKIEKSNISWKEAKKLNVKILYLQNITGSISAVEEYTRKLSYAKFFEDDVLQDAIFYRLENIDKAVKGLGRYLRKKIDDALWERIEEMGETATGDYCEAKIKRVWDIVKNDIPKLKKKINSVIDEEYVYFSDKE